LIIDYAVMMGIDHVGISSVRRRWRVEGFRSATGANVTMSW
jgi:hypothetical protein